MERVIEVRTYSVECVCDLCGEGLMKPTGVMFLTNPPLYPHVCNICNCQQTFPETYPVLRYKRIEVENVEK